MSLLFRQARLVVLFCLIASRAEASAHPDHVILVSIDGGKPAEIFRSQTPVLMRLAAEGACTWSATTIFPSQTLPSHTSMLTGVDPTRHGIRWNSWIPKHGVVQVPTVFQEARRAGLSTAMFVAKEKFRHLVQPGAVDRFGYDSATNMARAVARDAASYILAAKPNLCFIHFGEADSTGHRYGWGSPEQLKAFAEIDAALGQVLQAVQEAGIARRTVLIVTADHGGHHKTHGNRKPEDMEIPWVAWGQGVKPGFKITALVNTCDTAATALWLLDLPVPASFDGRPVTSAFFD